MLLERSWPGVLSHLERNWGVSTGRRGNKYGTPVVSLMLREQGTIIALFVTALY